LKHLLLLLRLLLVADCPSKRGQEAVHPAEQVADEYVDEHVATGIRSGTPLRTHAYSALMVTSTH
jgi:hypothetical protein